MNKHTPSTAKLPAIISVATLLLLLMALLPSAYAGQATDANAASAIQPPGKSLAAPAVSPTPAFTVYLPLVVRSAVGAGTSTPTQTATAGAATPAPTATPTKTATAGASTPTPTKTATPTMPPGTQGALFLTRTIKTDSASAAVDAAGGFHLAYVKYGAMINGNQVYYAYCAATVDCGIDSNWGTAILIDRVWEVQLALTSDGHPRLLLRGVTVSWDIKFFKYAACDVNCTNSANWTIADVTTSTFSPSVVMDNSYSGHHYFALDNLNRPRFLYQDTYTDAFYVYCDTACTSAANWWKYPINVAIFSDYDTYPTLAFTSLRQPRITAVMAGTDAKDYLTYITCDTVCNNLASWTYTALMERGSGHVSFVLRLTSSDQPRLVFEQGTISPGSGKYLWYWWCNNGCTNGANWAGSSVGAQGQAEDANLALDALNRPRVAFRSMSPDDGLEYFWCDTNCESASATWLGGLVEPISDLDVDWPIPPPTTCSISYWYGGFRPSLALDTAGNPRIGYVAQHWYGGGSCTVHEDYRAVRFVFFYSTAGPPPKATLVSPSGTINSSMPAYTWNAVATATYYQLYVSDSGAAGKIKAWFTPVETNCATGSGTCSITPSVALANGAAQWWIQTWNTLGEGPWSDGMSFTVAAGPPGKATLTSPSGNISTTTPTYAWKAVSGSTWYYLWVNDSGTGAGKIQKWYTAAQAGCTSGTGNCTVTPSVALASGGAQWWIQTYNDSGYGAWSDGMAFVVAGAGPPGKATLISPNGSTTSATPAYSWNAVSGSAWYQLWVNDSKGTAKIQKWYTAAEAGCSSGTGSCVVTPASSLTNGSYQWWVQTWNANGNGPWSDSLNFTIAAAQMRQSPVRRQTARSVQ